MFVPWLEHFGFIFFCCMYWFGVYLDSNHTWGLLILKVEDRRNIFMPWVLTLSIVFSKVVGERPFTGLRNRSYCPRKGGRTAFHRECVLCFWSGHVDLEQ